MKRQPIMTVNELYQSPYWISCLFLPSNDTQAVFLASGDKVICFVGKEDRLSSFPSYRSYTEREAPLEAL